MKRLIAVSIAALLIGCASFQSYFSSDASIVTTVSLATSIGLKYTIKDSNKRTAIANYIDVYAPAVRTITGSPTADQLTTQVNAFIPESVRHAYPEIAALVVPIVVLQYQNALAKYGTNTKELYRVLGDVAAGLEAGAAPYITQHLTYRNIRTDRTTRFAGSESPGNLRFVERVPEEEDLKQVAKAF